jgi:hypothetical protein
MLSKLVINQFKNQKLLITVIPKLNNSQLLVFEKIIEILKSNNNMLNFCFCKNQDSHFKNEVIIEKKSKTYRLFAIMSFIIFNPNRVLTWFMRIKFKESGFFISLNKLSKQLIHASKVFNSFDSILCWNPYCSTFGVMANFLAYYKKTIYTIEYSPIPGGLIVDKGFIVNSENLSLFSQIKNSRQIKSFFDCKQIESTNNYIQNKPLIPEMLVDSKRTKVLVLGLSDVDSGIYPRWSEERKLFYPIFKNSFDAAINLSRACKNAMFIFKPHPHHNIHNLDIKVTENLWIINGNAENLIEISDVVVGNGTKVENDVLLKNKPLINIGAGFCYHSGLSIVVDSIAAFQEVLKNVAHGNQQNEQLKKNMWFEFMYQLSFQTIVND